MDECVHGSLVAKLRGNGHDVIYAAVFGNKRRVPGIVYLRLRLEDRALQWPKLNDVVAHFGARLYGQYVVIDRNRFRARPLPEL